MPSGGRFSLARILVAIVASEALPILALVIVVFVYSLLRGPDSATPEEFAPMAGNWIGPIGGFLTTLLFARWAARRASERPLAHGIAIGIGTALLDIGLGILLAGSDIIQPLFVLSNTGRILAGILGGWLGARARIATGSC